MASDSAGETEDTAGEEAQVLAQSRCPLLKTVFALGGVHIKVLAAREG
jgi:hypothetical protein